MTKDDFITAYILGTYRQEQKDGVRLVDVNPWQSIYEVLLLDEAERQYEVFLENYDALSAIPGNLRKKRMKQKLLKTYEEDDDPVV